MDLRKINEKKINQKKYRSKPEKIRCEKDEERLEHTVSEKIGSAGGRLDGNFQNHFSLIEKAKKANEIQR